MPPLFLAPVDASERTIDEKVAADDDLNKSTSSSKKALRVGAIICWIYFARPGTREDEDDALIWLLLCSPALVGNIVEEEDGTAELVTALVPSPPTPSVAAPKAAIDSCGFNKLQSKSKGTGEEEEEDVEDEDDDAGNWVLL